MVWLYLDADGFFASCEEAADARLHGRPVGVVAGAAYADAPLIAVNTVAKREGLRSGFRVRDARARCPGLAVRPQRVERYVAVHERMVAAVGVVLPVVAVHSIDELSAQLAPRDDPPSVIERVKRSVAGALTERVPVSVGVAPSAWLAKTAAEAHKPSAAVVWRLADLPAVYADLELEDLPGAGPRICARLRRAGLATVRSIHDAPRSRVTAAWARSRASACAWPFAVTTSPPGHRPGARSPTGGCSAARIGAGAPRARSCAGSPCARSTAAPRAGRARGRCGSRS